MKKIMILGGGENQLPLIQAAKNEDYYIVLCDGAQDPIGKKYVDSFYWANTIDKKKVVEIAKQECIDGVISNSEPAMETVAAVVDALGLIGNSERTVQLLQSKCAFRQFQKKIGVFCPKSIESDAISVLRDSLSELSYPIIVKPSECSGSRGIAILAEYNDEQFERAFEDCRRFSRNNYVTVEEYVPQDSLLTVGGDIFVYRDRILWDGLASCIRYPNRKEVPGGEIWPIHENEEKLCLIKDTLAQILKKSGLVYGALNIEGYFYQGRFFVIEINVRQGGNAIPQLIYEHCGIDMYKLLVTTCVGDNGYFDDIINRNAFDNSFITNYVVFSEEEGCYDHIDIKDSVLKFVYRIVENVASGDHINKGINAGDAVAMVRMRFPDKETQMGCISDLPNCIRVGLK